MKGEEERVYQPKKKKCIPNLRFSLLPRSFANSMGKCLLQLYTLNPKHYRSTHPWPESSCHFIMILECTNCHHWITRCERKRHRVCEHEGRNNNVQCVQFLDDHSHEHYFPLRHPFPMTAPMLPRRHRQLPVRRRLGTVNGGRGRGLRDNEDDGVVAVGVEVAADGLGSVDSWKGEGWSDSQLLASCWAWESRWCLESNAFDPPAML